VPYAPHRPRPSWGARLFPYLLLAPTFVIVFLFTLKPTAGALIDSTLRPARLPQDPPAFVAFENYADLLDPSHHIGSRFGRVLGNTVLFALGTVGIGTPLALLFALLLNRRLRLLGLWRFAFVYPALLPLIAGASIWAFIFADQVGLATAILRALALPDVNWLGNPNLVLGSIILINIWSQTGYYMLFYLAGLQHIPRDLYEAAQLDGAGTWAQLRYLTLPLLRRTTLFILTISFAFAFQTVEQLQALTEGGPGDRSNLLLYFIYQNLGERRNWGYVNAMTIVLAGIVMLFTLANFVYFERRGREDDR
jgi:sn-glycerol 3-phosphate transport system permease protein